MDPLQKLQALLDEEYCDYCTEFDLEIKQRKQALHTAQRCQQLQQENVRLTHELQQLRTELRPTESPCQTTQRSDKVALRAAALAVRDQLVLEGRLNGLAAVHEWLIQEVTAARQLVFVQPQAKLEEAIHLKRLLAEAQDELSESTAQLSSAAEERTEHQRLVKQTESLRKELRKVLTTRTSLSSQVARLRKLAYGKNTLKN